MDKLMYPYIDQLTEPPILGETYMVPCYKQYWQHSKYNIQSDQLQWMDLEDSWNREIHKVRFIPLINNSHTDYESGQFQAHYHVDFRFINYIPEDEHGSVMIRINSSLVTTLHYRPMILLTEEQECVTSPELIANTKLSYNKIHKHKCPHRGFDLRQVKPKDGCITCPLHGLKFRADTHELIR